MRTPSLNLQTALILTALVTVAVEARGELIVSNLDEENFGSYSGGYSFFAMANSFTTGPDATILNSVTLLQNDPNSTGKDPANYIVRVYSDQGGAPGTNLATLTTPSDELQGQTAVTFTGSLALAANTTYWLYEKGIQNYEPVWAATLSPNETSTDSWTIGDSMIYTSDNGNSWHNDSRALQFSIDATAAVPEPGSLLLSSIVAAPVLTRAWRRRKLARSISAAA